MNGNVTSWYFVIHITQACSPHFTISPYVILIGKENHYSRVRVVWDSLDDLHKLSLLWLSWNFHRLWDAHTPCKETRRNEKRSRGEENDVITFIISLIIQQLSRQEAFDEWEYPGTTPLNNPFIQREHNGRQRFYNVTFVHFWLRKGNKWSRGNVQMNMYRKDSLQMNVHK